ncbi:DUF4231 domain-containing protein [Nostoc sp. CMAA1605]|uniref:DUF4231 domain-containing protein n=1 Tax=Nostoc sp. CMAA1605 TaxID=2055159 RepID=UPI001F2E6E44|nr:DUF4231 domain-containing protein [Nostoc sp. CMAA1605]MCF4969025.1 DUF4231 domain-containing protein [Nostoc sp. CMAA1605]
MAKQKDTYQEFLKQDFNQLFEIIKLRDEQRHFLRSRWLDQILWMEGKANQARDRYYKLRITTIIGGIILPALVSINSINNPSLGNNKNFPLKEIIVWSTFGLSQVVAISAAVEEFFHYGERWRHYRRTVESLKTQGWQFSQLAGIYHQYPNHEQAFNTFASQVEDIIQRDVEIYSTQVVQEKTDEKQQQMPENIQIPQTNKINSATQEEETVNPENDSNANI